MFASAGPIHNFDEDLFRYGEFARALARGLVNRSNITEPYVVGIDAAWGMGKTSAAQLIRKAFTEIGAEDPSDERRVHVIEFQPWLVSSLVWKALRAVPEQEREVLVEETIENSPSVAMVSIVWQRLVLRAGLRGYETNRPELLLSEQAIDRLGQLLAGRLLLASGEQDFENTPLLGWVLQTWDRTGVAEGLNDAANRLVLRDVGLINILDGLMGHSVSSDRGQYRSVRDNASVANLTQEQLQECASRALTRTDFPSGIENPEIADIARQMLSAYIDGINAV